MSTEQTITDTVITPEAFLSHWQGHRTLTRRIIDAFPEDKLFSFSIGGMRSFGMLGIEMLGMAVPMVTGIVTGETGPPPHHNTAWMESITGADNPKEELLKQWDETTEKINTLWPQIAHGRFLETLLAFGQYEGRIFDLLLYIVDNEIHHRGQGYVYLRALGIEPAPFYER